MARVVINPQRQRFIKLLPLDRIDPVARLFELFEIIRRCIHGANYRLTPRDQQLETVTQAVLYLLRRARSLSRLRFWDELQLCEEPPWGAAEEPLAVDRQKRINDAIELLEGKSTTFEDVISAMDTAERAFRSMHDQFTFGVMPEGFEEISDEERFMCSALLGPVVNLFDHAWLPLRSKIRKVIDMS